MRKDAGWLWIAGFLGSLAAANAQTQPPSAPVTAFDGTYAFISATNINDIFVPIGNEHPFPCGHLQRRGPLIIVKGEAQHSGPHRDFEGTIGPRGELTMRAAPEPTKLAGGSPGIERTINGRIDGNGTVRARFMDKLCNYELVWQKQISVHPQNQQ